MRHLLEDFVSDLRYGGRQLRRSPGTTTLAALSLALGLGANIAIFSLVKAVFLQPLDVPEPRTLVGVFRTLDVETAGAGAGAGLLPTSYPNYLDLVARTRSLRQVSAVHFGQFALASREAPEMVTGTYVTPNHFQVLGLEPAAGRFFQEDELRASVVVISWDLWQERFGGDRIVGETIRLNGVERTVIGVAPRGFDGTFTLGSERLWLPMGLAEQLPGIGGLGPLEHRGNRAFLIFGRLAPEISAQAVGEELDRIAADLASEHPDWNRDRGFRALPIEQAMLNPNQRSLFVRSGALMMGAVGLVLLVACANVANLALAKTRSRRRELAMRSSLGAGRVRLVRQLLTESLLLVGLGALAGALLSIWLKGWLWSLRPPFLENADLDIGSNGMVVAFAVGLALLAALLSGLAPAVSTWRTDLVAATRGDIDRDRGSRFLFRRGLVVLQAALCLVTLVAAGLFLASLRQALSIDPGFDHESLLVTSIDLSSLEGDDEQRRLRLAEMAREVGALPGVESVAVAGNPPIGFSFAYRVFPVGAEDRYGSEGVYINLTPVSPGYFATLGVDLVEGRAIDDRDRSDGRLVAVVNRTLAARYWPGESALGKSIRWPASDRPFEIIGVAPDLKYQSLGEEPLPFFYRPLEQDWRPAVTLLVRSSDPQVVLPQVERKMRQLEPDLPLVDTMVVTESLHRSLWAARLGAALLALFGLVALVLAAVGVYGVVSERANQERREIGVRVALGADRGSVLRHILIGGLLPVAAGVALGLSAAIIGLRFTAGLLFETSASDPSVLGAAALLLLAVAACACALPALRSAAANPVEALRAD